MRRFKNRITFRLTDVLRIDKEIKKELFEMFLNCLYSWYPREGSTGNGPQGLTE
nr:MAG TPA: hypothetical protein [Bacteriophage sp.]